MVVRTSKPVIQIEMAESGIQVVAPEETDHSPT
jgi:hypothetical protein